uniref:Uncharacterized protein n=1 Tax=Callorhinchus milii TaxID=7868 RepID=A0A4W3K6M1_CALMI
MRVALSDPQPERRFFRRAWVTFDRSVNIKEICWNLQNIRLRECELSPVVNRDLARRVRSINGLTQHKQIVRNDIKLAAKLIHSLDDRSQLWSSESLNEDGRVEVRGLFLPCGQNSRTRGHGLRSKGWVGVKFVTNLLKHYCSERAVNMGNSTGFAGRQTDTGRETDRHRETGSPVAQWLEHSLCK